MNDDYSPIGIILLILAILIVGILVVTFKWNTCMSIFHNGWYCWLQL